MSQESLTSMSGSTSSRDSKTRPRPLHVSKSFSRLETPTSNPLARHRASTIQTGTIAEMLSPEVLLESSPTDGRGENGDLFDREGSEDGTNHGTDHDASDEIFSPKPEILPIELLSLTDRYIDSLSAKVHPTPPSIEKLSALFQDFYVLASSHISIHIATLSSRQQRKASPSPSSSSRSSSTAKPGKTGSQSSKDKSLPERTVPQQQMLTSSEIENKRKARRQLEQTRVALEEAVERRVCEAVYDRIWRHRSTEDEERDEKLRSRTAALGVVGVGLHELSIDVGTNPAEDPAKYAAREEKVREWLSDARECLMNMNNTRYPLGKLLHLKAAHKSIVDTLSHFHPSSSSADEILPTLIYTLITTPTEGINVISNLYFIQRFRAASKVDGEAAYCLTNLEAAITFLENVDLASLKPDDVPGASTPKSEKDNPLGTRSRSSSGAIAPTTTHTTPTHAGGSSLDHLKAGPSPTLSRPTTPSAPSHQRRLSHLLQPPANALGYAGDAVIMTADQGLKTIGNTLESSYKFLFGRLKERQVSVSGQDGNAGEVVMPKTLDDARKLVGTPPPAESLDEKIVEDGIASGGSLVKQDQTESPSVPASVADDKVLNLIGGHKMGRERSVDSARSGGSGKRVAFEKEPLTTPNRPPSTSFPAAAVSTSSAAVESMRSLGNTLNPLNRFSGMNVMRSFGRTAVSPQPTATSNQAAGEGSGVPTDADLGEIADLATTFPDLAPVLPPKDTPKIAPPIKRFMELENPGDLRISEVLELLRDYRRLACALSDMGALSS